MKHKLLPILLFLFAAGKSYSQTQSPVCPSDFWRQQYLQNPDFQEANSIYEQEVLEVFQGKKGHQGMPEQTRTVPVVVHIIHDNGPENISDAEVQQAIQWLNQALSNQGVFDQGSGANTEIQLCLAQRTPTGEVSNGITRDQSALTEMQMETQDVALKNLNRWKPKDYLNIWLVRSICSVTYGCNVYGYANYPFAHGSNIDGIVIEAAYLTNINKIRGLAHETGHYFGLYHTFEGGCANNNCLTDGDRICDTPPDQSTVGIPCSDQVNTCTTDTQSGPFSSDQPDMTWNYMDYGHLECFHDYTPDQSTRMNATLDGVRHSLLESKGCLPPCPGNAVASFIYNGNTVEIGETVDFQSTSQNAAAVQWTIDGINFGNQPFASYTFNAPGWYTVTLEVTPANPVLCEPDHAQVMIHVICPVEAAFSLSSASIGQHDTVQVINQSKNAIEYNWYLNGSPLALPISPLVFDAAGTYHIQLIAGNGFCTDTADQTITVHTSCEQKTFEFNISSPYAPPVLSFVHSAELLDGNLVLSYFGIGNDDNAPIVVKVTPAGKVQWAKSFAAMDSSQAPEALIRPAPAGGFYLLWWETVPNATQNSFMLAKIGADGAPEWVHKLSAQVPYFYLSDFLVNADGTIILGGEQLVKLDASGQFLWGKAGVHVNKLAAFPDGGIIAINESTAMRWDAQGNVLWYKGITAGQSSFLNTVTVTPEGSIYLAGNATPVNSTSKGYLVKLDDTGNSIWSYTYSEGNGITYDFFELAITADNSLVISGQALLPSASGLQPYTILFKVSLDGNLIWVRHRPNHFNTSSLKPLLSGGIMIAGIENIGSPSFPQKVRLLTTDAEGLQKNCAEEPHLITPFDITTKIKVYSITPNPIIVDVLPVSAAVKDLNWQLDTLCAPDCQDAFEICDNNIDDDGDGLFDCLDPECACERDRCLPRYSDKWFFGNQTGLDFQSGKLKLLPGGKTQTTEAYSSICDPRGNLLFYTDGKKVYNRFHEMMPNGDLGGANALTQVLIIPYPNQASLYFLFGISTLGELSYSLISMALENGKGDIQAAFKNLNVDVDCHGLAAIASCGFNGFWMLTNKGTNKLLTYKIDQSGLNLIPSSTVNIYLQSLRQLKISSNGYQVACTALNATNGLWSVALFDFNPFSAGTISNAQWLDEVGSGFEILGVEFSPNGRFLYLSGKFPGNIKVRQYDLEAGDINAIRASKVDLAFLPGKITGYLQLAPDGKIYASSRQNIFQEGYYLDVIEQPDQAGIACQFQHEAIDMSDLAPPGGSVIDWLPNVISGISHKPRIHFPYDSPDTICTLNVPIKYEVKNLPCTVNSFLWGTDQLSATLVSFVQTAQITFTQPGKGKLIASFSDECGSTADTLNIIVANPAPQTLNLGPDITICQNGVITLHAGGGFARYLWSDNTADSATTTLQPGQYWVKAWDACGNLYSDTILISVAPNSVLDLGEIPVQCPGFTQSFQRPAGFSSWQWAPADFLNCTNCPTVTIQPDQNAVWTILATTADGCISVDTLNATIRDTLPIQLDTFACANISLSLFGATLPPDTTAQFFFPRAGITCDTLWTVNVMQQDNPLGQIEVKVCPDAYFNFHGILLPPDTSMLIPVSHLGECDSLITVSTHRFPALSVQLPQDTTIKIGASVLLKTQVTGANPFSLQWTPAESLSCADCPDPLASPLDTLTYFLSVTDANGCTGSGSVTLRVQEICRVQVPSAFTPNGDGANDVFRPICDPCVKTVLQWRIFNRWGQNVFSQFNFPPADPSFGWDGRDQEGKAQASDVYIWTLEVEYFDGRREQQQKEVTLIR